LAYERLLRRGGVRQELNPFSLVGSCPRVFEPRSVVVNKTRVLIAPPHVVEFTDALSPSLGVLKEHRLDVRAAIKELKPRLTVTFPAEIGLNKRRQFLSKGFLALKRAPLLLVMLQQRLGLVGDVVGHFPGALFGDEAFLRQRFEHGVDRRAA